MNRGNLAEDPKAGLSSSSRYSRGGRERNSLLYVDSSTVRKERRAAERRAGRADRAVKGNHNSRKNTSVGRGLADSHMDRLEVGSDGRLFHVKESKYPAKPSSKASSEKITSIPEASSKEQYKLDQAADIRPAIGTGIISGAGNTSDERKDRAEAVQLRTDSPEAVQPETDSPEAVQLRTGSPEAVQPETDRPAGKPKRDYLAQSNPLLTVRKPETDTEASRGVWSAVRGFLHRFRVPVIASVVTAASIGYGYTAWHYRNRFYPGTEFFSIPAAELSVYDVKAAVKAKVDTYSLQLVAREPKADAEDLLTAAGEAKAESGRMLPAGGSAKALQGNVIDAEDVGMIYRDGGEIDRAMKRQKSWAWPVMMLAQLFGKQDFVLETSFDESLVSEALDSLDCMQKENMIEPQDAKVILTDNGAQVQTEIYGTTLDRARTEEAVREALANGSTKIDLDDLGLYVNPKVTSSDLSLITQAMAMNKVLGAKILVRFGSHTEVVNSEVISTFLDKNGASYTLNEEKVRDYVTGLAEKYDTFQKEREFFTSIGTTFMLEEGVGDYGWLMDQEATYEEILTGIKEQKKRTIEPVWTQEAYCAGTDDIGDTYVEISLTNQMMWFYKNGELIVETPVVTGNPYAGYETPSGGVWSIKGKSRNQTLSGQGYNTPVDYWMPFNNGVGIHDLQSRAWFGGTIYLGSGSHGCVNTPLSAVKLIYDQMEDGVPVVVYKDESEEALSLVTGPTDVQTLNAQIEETYGTVEDDGIGSIVAWSRSQAAQAAAAAAAAQAAGASAGTSVS